MKSTATKGLLAISMCLLFSCQNDRKITPDQSAQLELSMNFEFIIYEVSMGKAKEIGKRYSSNKSEVRSSRSLNHTESINFFAALDALDVLHWKTDYGTGPDDDRTEVLSWRLIYKNGSRFIASQGVGSFPSDSGVTEAFGPNESRVFRKIYEQFHKITRKPQ